MSRIYSNVSEAVKEIEREIFEMALTVKSYSYQDKVIEGDEDFDSKELQGYTFKIVGPDPVEALKTVEEWYGLEVKEWVEAEFDERVSGPMNPGEAWKLRRDVWEQFLESDGKFGYTYSERMAHQLDPVINELKEHPGTRQAIIEMHNNDEDLARLGGRRRIPCSLQYQFMIRREAMDCIYVMRSSDFATHFIDDITLAILLQDYIRSQVGIEKMGTFTMFISSLHCFNKDLKAKGIF